YRQDAHGKGTRDIRTPAWRAGVLGPRKRDGGRTAVLAVGAGRARVSRAKFRRGETPRIRTVRGGTAADFAWTARPLPGAAGTACDRIRGMPVPAVRRDERLPARRVR